MYSVELATLLHHALTARMRDLLDGLAAPHWQGDPEGLHAVRVASRRLRAVLDLVDPELYPAYGPQSRNLRKLTRALGRTRELDVHAGLLEGLRSRLAQVEPLCALEHALERLRGRDRKARATMGRDLDRLSLKRLPRLLEVPRLSNPFAPGDLGRGAWDCLESWLEDAFQGLAGLLEQEDEAALHQARIRIKRLRYAVEILAPAFALEPDTELAHLKALQQALGSYHDLATLGGLLEDLRRGLAARERSHLAAGTAALLALVLEERLCAFEQFRVLVLECPGPAFSAMIKRNLGIQEGNQA